MAIRDRAGGRRGSPFRPGAKSAVHPAALFLAIALFACSGDAERALETGALSYAHGLALSIVDDQLLPFAAPESRRYPEYKAPQAAAMAAIGHRAAIALNRHGVAFLDFDTQGMRVSVRHSASDEFGGRSVGALFAETAGEGREFRLLLYRHPDESESESRQGALLALDVVSGSIGKAEMPAPIDEAGLYALFPVSGGERLVATREPSADRVRTGHWLWTTGTGAPPLALSRSEFEERLKPLGRAEAPPALLAAVDALTADSAAPLLVEARLPSGELGWYALGAGPAADRVEIIAALSANGRSALAAYPAGPLAVCAPRDDGSLRAERVELGTPRPDAVWTSALLLADDGGAQAAILAWREDYFPDSGASGILVAPLFR